MDITGDGGILKEIIREGTGEPIPNGKLAIVHYTGKLSDWTTFDSSRSRGKPFSFVVGNRSVILGWDKGVKTMKKGELCMLTCAPDYAYGSKGIGPIPGNSTLMFEVELLDWQDDELAPPYGAFTVLAVAALLGIVFYFRKYLF